MKTWLSIISVMILVGLLAGMALQVQAQDEPEAILTFHVLPNGIAKSTSLETIPPDAPDKILIQGTIEAATNVTLQAKIRNYCGSWSPAGTGTPTATNSPTPTFTPTGVPTQSGALECYQVDIYWTMTIIVSWSNGWYTDTYGSFNYTDKDLTPTVTYTYGGSDNPLTLQEKCGDPYTRVGTCAKELTGIIPAADMVNGENLTDEFIYHELFEATAMDTVAGNSSTIEYIITLSTTPIPDEAAPCAGQYLTGAALGSFTVQATDSAGVEMIAALHFNVPQNGSWYKLVISGSWKNNGTGPDLRTMETKRGPTGFWFPLDANPLTGCADINNSTYYLQAGAGQQYTYYRVYDPDNVFLDNTGSLLVTVYAVSAYTRYQSGCELQYQVGDLIEQRTVDSTWARGQPLESPINNRPIIGGGSGQPEPKRYYMLETTGGPVNLGDGTFSYNADLGQRASDTAPVPDNWYEIATAPFVTCVASTDLLGHVKVFFLLDEQTDLYKFTEYYYSFRVRDGGGVYTDNSGTLTYSLYQASNMQITLPGIVPDATGCSAYGHVATTTRSIVINALNNDDGTLLPSNLVSGHMYAFDVVDGPWRDNVTDSYKIQISDDNGSNWVDLQDYPQLLCAASLDGDHVIIYVYHAAGKIWRARVADLDSNFSDNSLSIGLKIYAGNTSIVNWPTCAQDYTLTEIPLGEEARKVPGNMESGKALPGIVSGKIYSVLITGDAMWYEASAEGSYLVDISDDGGATWQPLEDYTGKLCAEGVGDGGRFQLFFTATSNNYKLRVRDGDDNFLSNTGYVLFKLYTAVDTSNPPPGDGGKPPAEWIVACYEHYARPSTFIAFQPIGPILGTAISLPVPRVAEWIDYLRNSITYYFAWCPEHTAALKTMTDVALDKDPMKSIMDMVNFVKQVQTMLDSYQAGGGAVTGLTSQEPYLFSDANNLAPGGGEGPFDPGPHPSTAGWDLFSVFSSDNSVWFGHPLELSAGYSSNLSGMGSYTALCAPKFESLMGILSDPFCNLMYLTIYTQVVTWILLGLDLFLVIWYFIKYMPNYLKRFYNLIAENKTLIKKIGG